MPPFRHNGHQTENSMSSMPGVLSLLYIVAFCIVFVALFLICKAGKVSAWLLNLILPYAPNNCICKALIECLQPKDEANCCKSVCDKTIPQKCINAGNEHKLHQRWEEAGESFEQAANSFLNQRRCEHDAANNFAEAANCYRKLRQPFYTQKAVECLETAAKMYAEMGQFSIAGRHLEDAGDLAKLIGDQHSSTEAIRLYKKAADFWNGEDSPASAAGSLTKAANLMADIGMLNDAARVFEDLGMSAQNHNLLVFGAKDHMFKSCLCVLCSNPSLCSEMADDLRRKCDTFSNSDEQSLVMKLSAAVENQDISAFDTAVAEFERLNNLDDWMRRRLDDARKSASRESAQLM